MSTDKNIVLIELHLRGKRYGQAIDITPNADMTLLGFDDLCRASRVQLERILYPGSTIDNLMRENESKHGAGVISYEEAERIRKDIGI